MKENLTSERFIRKLMNKIYERMTSISKNVYINKLDNIVNKHNKYYSTIKTKPVDVKSSTYIDSGKDDNESNPKFKIGDTFRISK